MVEGADDVIVCDVEDEDEDGEAYFEARAESTADSLSLSASFRGLRQERAALKARAKGMQTNVALENMRARLTAMGILKEDEQQAALDTAEDTKEPVVVPEEAPVPVAAAAEPRSTAPTTSPPRSTSAPTTSPPRSTVANTNSPQQPVTEPRSTARTTSPPRTSPPRSTSARTNSPPRSTSAHTTSPPRPVAEPRSTPRTTSPPRSTAARTTSPQLEPRSMSARTSPQRPVAADEKEPLVVDASEGQLEETLPPPPLRETATPARKPPTPPLQRDTHKPPPMPSFAEDESLHSAGAPRTKEAYEAALGELQTAAEKALSLYAELQSVPAESPMTVAKEAPPTAAGQVLST